MMMTMITLTICQLTETGIKIISEMMKTKNAF